MTTTMTPIELRDHALWATKVLRPYRAGAMRRDDARNLVRRTLAVYAAKRNLHIYAWGLQPSRIHVLVQIPIEFPLTDALAEAFGYYTRRFNARYRKSGSVFRTKFLRQVVVGPLAITEAIRRVNEAPSISGVVPDPTEEPWSSAACYELGGRSDGVVTLYKPTHVRRATLIADVLDAGER